MSTKRKQNQHAKFVDKTVCKKLKKDANQRYSILKYFSNSPNRHSCSCPECFLTVDHTDLSSAVLLISNHLTNDHAIFRYVCKVCHYENDNFSSFKNHVSDQHDVVENIDKCKFFQAMSFDDNLIENDNNAEITFNIFNSFKRNTEEIFLNVAPSGNAIHHFFKANCLLCDMNVWINNFNQQDDTYVCDKLDAILKNHLKISHYSEEQKFVIQKPTISDERNNNILSTIVETTDIMIDDYLKPQNDLKRHSISGPIRSSDLPLTLLKSPVGIRPELTDINKKPTCLWENVNWEMTNVISKFFEKNLTEIEIHHCPFCGFAVSGTSMGTVLTSIVTQHLLEIHKVPNYSCKLCNFVTNNGRSAINDHLTSNHHFERIRTFRCKFPLCGANCFERSQIMDHVLLHNWLHDGQRFNVNEVTVDFDKYFVDNYAGSVVVRANQGFCNDVNKRCITASCKHCDLVLIVAPSDDKYKTYSHTIIDTVHSILKEHHSSVHRRPLLMCCRCGLRVRELNVRLADEHKRLCTPSARRRSLCTHGKGNVCTEWIDLTGSIQHYDVSVPGRDKRIQRAASAEPYLQSEKVDSGMEDNNSIERNRRKQKRPRQVRKFKNQIIKVDYKIGSEMQWMNNLKDIATQYRKNLSYGIINENTINCQLMKDYFNALTSSKTSNNYLTVYLCDLCGFSSTATNQTYLIALLTRHLKDVHKLLNFSCVLCKKSDEKKEIVIHHLIIDHLNRIDMGCPFANKCNDILTTYNEFSDHILGHLQSLKSSPLDLDILNIAVIDSYPEFIQRFSIGNLSKETILSRCHQISCILCDMQTFWMPSNNQNDIENFIELPMEQMTDHIERDHHKKRYRCSECNLPVQKLSGATIDEHNMVCSAGFQANWVKYDLTNFLRKSLINEKNNKTPDIKNSNSISSSTITNNNNSNSDTIDLIDKTTGKILKKTGIRKFNFDNGTIIKCPLSLAPCLSVFRQEAICGLCFKGFLYKNISIHLSKDHDLKQYSCRFCSYQQDSINDVRSHQLDRHGPCYCLCELCHMEFRRKDELEKHLSLEHNTNSIESVNLTTYSLNGRSKLTNQHESAYQLINQLEVPELIKVCPKCLLVLISKDNHMEVIFYQHLKSKHNLEKYQCNFCEFSTDNLQININDHFKKNHYDKSMNDANLYTVLGDSKMTIEISDFNFIHSCKRCCFAVLLTNTYDPLRLGYQQIPEELSKHISKFHNFGSDLLEDSVKLTSVVDIKSSSILKRKPSLPCSKTAVKSINKIVEKPSNKLFEKSVIKKSFNKKLKNQTSKKSTNDKLPVVEISKVIQNELENLDCVFVCNDCGFLIASSSTFANSLIGLATRHVMELHLPRPYSCAKCGAAWETRQEVIEHCLHSHRSNLKSNNSVSSNTASFNIDELVIDLCVCKLKQIEKLNLKELTCDKSRIVLRCSRCQLTIITDMKIFAKCRELLEFHLMRTHFLRKFKCTDCGFQSNTVDGQDVYDHNQLCSISKLAEQDFSTRLSVYNLPA